LASHFGVLGRIEYRDAFVWLGDPNAPGAADRAYLTKGWRATGGVHVNFTDRIILKLEYLHNGEYGGIPQIKDDVFTSSLVLID
jgi:opacity protein-like surface antigen